MDRRARVASAWKAAAWATVALVAIVTPKVYRELTKPDLDQIMETFRRAKREAKQFENVDVHRTPARTAADARLVEQLADLRRQRAAMELEHGIARDVDAGVADAPEAPSTAPACLAGFHRYGDSVNCTPDTSRRR